MRRTHHPNQPDPQQQSQYREEEQATAGSIQAGYAQAQKKDPMADMDYNDFLSVLQDPDIESDEYEDLEDILKPHLSGTNVTTFYAEEDRKRIELRNFALAKQVIRERQPGRLCTGPFLEVAQQVDDRSDKAVKLPWTDDERRAVREILMDVKSNMQFLGINHTGLTKTADTTVETRVQRVGEDGGKKGRLARAQEKVFG